MCRKAYRDLNKDKARARDQRYRAKKKLKASWRSIPHEKQKKIKDFAYSMAHKWQIPDAADDIAQAILEHELHGKLNRKWDHVAIDFVRSTFGGTKNKEKRNPLMDALPLDVTHAAPMPDTTLADIYTMVKQLYPDSHNAYRIAFLLHFKYGLNQHEIGEILGLDNSRIYQYIDTVLTKLKKRYNRG